MLMKDVLCFETKILGRQLPTEKKQRHAEEVMSVSREGNGVHDQRH